MNGVEGNTYRLIIRQNRSDRDDFSIILALAPLDTSQDFRLRRYNGTSHEHTNLIEKDTFRGFHIHTATERYQLLGSREDSYAEPTDRFDDFDGALGCMLRDCGFVAPDDPQLTLFEEV